MAPINMGFFKPSLILPGKSSQFKFCRLKICLVTFTARTLGNAIHIRPLFITKNNILNFISFALPAYWHRNLKLCLGLNFQHIWFPIARVLVSEVKKLIDFHHPKNSLSDFCFVKYKSYNKMVNVNSISFTEMYHNIFFDFQIFEFRLLLWRHTSGQYFPAFSIASALISSISSIVNLNCFSFADQVCVFSWRVHHPVGLKKEGSKEIKCPTRWPLWLVSWKH